MAVLTPRAVELKDRAFKNINNDIIKNTKVFSSDNKIETKTDLNGLFRMMCYLFDESKDKYSLNNRLIMYGQLLEHGISDNYLFSYDEENWEAKGQTVKSKDGLRALYKKEYVKVKENGEIEKINNSDSKQGSEVLFDVINKEFTINELGLISDRKRELYNSLSSQKNEKSELNLLISKNQNMNISRICEELNKTDNLDRYVFGLQLICALNSNCMIEKNDVISQMENWTNECSQNGMLPNLSQLSKIEDLSKTIDMQNYREFTKSLKENDYSFGNNCLNKLFKENELER